MKRLLALLLVLALSIGILPIGVFAEEKPTIALTADVSTDLKIGDEFTVTASLSNNTGFATLMLKLLWNSDVLEFKGFETVYDEDEEVDVLKDTILGGTIVFSNDTAMVTNSRSNNSSKNGAIFAAKFKVVGYGNCNISFDQTSASVFEFRAIDATDNTKYNDIDASIDVSAVSALTVTDSSQGGDEGGNEQQPTTSDYEIWYELDSETDNLTTTANYKDYEYNTAEGAMNQVTAEIFLKSNNADVTVQAYDIYLDYHSNLTYNSTENMVGAVYKTVDENNTVAAGKGDKVTHIQLVKDSGNTISLKQGTEVSLGTIIFDIASGAVYDDDMHITLTVAADAENTAKTEAVTNISLATNDGGQVASYYPMETGTDLGAEVVNTYTVSFDTNDGTPTTISAQTVGYNLTATEPEEPSKSGYEFAGWYNGDTAFDFTTKITKNTDLTAKWNVATANYTVEHWQQNVEGTDYAKVDSDTETKSGQTGATTEAAAKTYAGFTAQTITQGTIAADGSTVVVVKYDRNSYTITVNKDNGTEAGKITGLYGSDVTKPADPTKTGYTFAGWDVNGDGKYDTTDTFPTTMPVDGLTVKAIWNPVTYTVTYNSNTGSGSMTASTFTYDAADQKLAANTFTKTGYTFNGWNTQADGQGTSYNDQNDVGNDWYTTHGEAVTLYAQWKANEYTVIFDGNGATSGEMAEQTFTYDVAQKLTKNAFEKTDDNYTYTFAGWTLGGKTYSDEAEVKNLAESGTVTLVAQWTTNYVVSTYATAGQGTAIAQPGTAAAGQQITVTVTPENGYQIEKVTYTADGETEAEDITMTGNTGTFTMPAANVSVNATFTAIPYNVTVTNPTDGNGTITATGTTDGKATVGTEITLSNDPADGYELVEYTVKDASQNPVTVTDGKFTMPASAVTVTATFKTISYTITYEENGGTEVQDSSYTVVDTVTLPGLDSTTKTGYTFAGWYTDSGLTGNAVTQIDVGSTENKIFYAKWTPNDNTAYTVKHWLQNINGGTEQNAQNYTLQESDTQNLTGTTGASITPPVKSYTGFTAPATQTVTIAADGSTVVNYYYTRNTYTITYDSNGGSAVESGTYTYGTSVDPLPTPTKDGYEFDGWYDGDSKVESITTTDVGNKNLTAKWTAITYTIAFNPNGGNDLGSSYSNNKMTYTIESTVTLPEPTRAYYIFTGWKLETTNGKWTAGTYNVYETDGVTEVEYTQMYGVKDQEMELVAQWTRAATPVVEEYKYAYTDYWMIRVPVGALTATQEYQFDGKSMYYIEDTNYNIDSAGVFYTLIPAETADGTKYIENSALTDAGYNKLTIGDCSARATITYDGDVNGDNVLNIADANIVYQMVEQTSKGGYYSMDQLDVEARLKADMDKAAGVTTDDHRGSIDDVNVIVNKINGVTPTT